MAYENLKLANAAISGDIYLTRILKDGVMSDNRRIITNECLAATADWFLANDEKYTNWEAIDDVHPHLFFTGDLNKAERIKAILEEEVAE
ncbi:hypothetical protein CW768_11660 [Listeria monocytogenes]|uniref:DUF7446 family protein n=1 Tax=Listeria monocytogenes TaxID=1639 RepID=UPI000DC58998|nr:hypothetical protein [Listeria monocytogenes]EAC3620580.1 hypothetical protein [Listeria monocytogenes]EAC7151259.1 hypothetical protein [Listeria monocytogenes]EAF4255877.1 hypothetical protein [Listeria monocytogenes]EAF4263952.1 hypothetical protein [Listeria monocytogenes]EAF6520851.1 hypothetical protein [Listeria monocytogenes]